MDNAPLPPCSELGQGPEHTLLYEMGRKANRRSIAPADFDTSRNAPHLKTLLDGGYIERLDCEAIRFKVLVTCPGNSFPTGTPRNGRECNLPRSGGLHEASDKSVWTRRGQTDAVAGITAAITESAITESVGHPSARTRTRPDKPDTILARDIFPQLTNRHGYHPYQHNWPALVAQIRRWPYDLDFVRLMMEEFSRHPEWCKGRAPWRVFVGRRQVLVDLVLTRQKREPTRFWDRHSPLASSPA